MKNLLIFLLLAGTSILQAQSPLPILQPEIDPYVPDFSPEGLAKLKETEKRYWEIAKKDLPFSELSKEDQWIFQNFDETKESPYEVLGAGCSWYCGGDTIGIRSSSHLPSQKKQYSYVAKNAHDLSYATAWVEGVEGNGIGEYLEYRFDNTHPRVTEIIIHNGYVKSEKAWRDNGRVKKLRMILDGTPYAILDLKDLKAAQRFKFEPLGRRKDGKDMYIRFEIMEVYPGDKYEDVAITELYFNGMDVHCLAGESMITMADHTIKRIDEIKVGEQILIYHLEKKKTGVHTVDHIFEVRHSAIGQLHFDNNLVLTVTPDHPLYSLNKGWAAIDPEAANRYHHYSNIQMLEPGDTLLLWDKNQQKMQETVLKNYTRLEEATRSYALSGLPEGWAFFANGLLVAGDQALND